MASLMLTCTILSHSVIIFRYLFSCRFVDFFLVRTGDYILVHNPVLPPYFGMGQAWLGQNMGWWPWDSRLVSQWMYALSIVSPRRFCFRSAKRHVQSTSIPIFFWNIIHHLHHYSIDIWWFGPVHGFKAQVPAFSPGNSQSKHQPQVAPGAPPPAPRHHPGCSGGGHALGSLELLPGLAQMLGSNGGFHSHGGTPMVNSLLKPTMVYGD